MYPYGPGEGDTVISHGDDISSPAIPLPHGLVVGVEQENTAYV